MYESEFGQNFSFNQTLSTTETDVYIGMELVATQATRYLRLEHPGVFANFRVDAVSYCTEVCVEDPPSALVLATPSSPQMENLTQGNPEEIAAKMLIYPNPSSGQVQISLSGLSASEGNLLILNQNGQMVYQQRLDLWEQKVFSLNLNEKQLPAGAYIIQYRSAQDLITEKLILTE